MTNTNNRDNNNDSNNNQCNNNNTIHNLTIGHCNIQGGLLGINKSKAVSNLINKYTLDILALNETNLNSTIDTKTINIPATFNFERKDRDTGSSRGGCGLLISKKLAYEEVKISTDIANIEALWIKIKSINIFVCGFYRSQGYCNINNFIDYMNICMNKLRGKKVIWIGDINVDQNNINDTQYKKLDIALRSFNLVQTIQGITRYSMRKNTLTKTTIDVIFTNCYSEFVNNEVLIERIGDHQAIKCEINFTVTKPAKFEKITIRDHSKFNIDSFAEFLKNGSEHEFKYILNCSDAELAAVCLNEHLNFSYEVYCPLKSIKVHEKFIFKPSKELLYEMKKQEILYKKFRKLLRNVEGSAPNCNRCRVCTKCIKCNKAWDKYKVQRNNVTSMKKYNKRQNVIEDLKAKSARNDLTGIWKTIKLASNMAPASNPQNNDKHQLDPNVFNEHFSTIGPKIQSKIPLHKNIDFKQFMPSVALGINLEEFTDVSCDEVLAYIDSISSNKSNFDIMPLKIFKAIMPHIIKPLTHVINLSLKTGVFPSFCKQTRITPIHKNGDKDDVDNYRPISILPVIAKCIEYFVSTQITGHMEQNNLFSNRQYGFRKNYSTTYLMLDLFDEVYDSKSKSMKPAIIFLDIRKAFDTVHHEILIDKLRHYGIGGTALIWISNFLHERYQCTKVGNHISTFLEILCGIPQGSILGPLLFSIFINDLELICNLSIPYLFADDGALLFKDTCRKSFINLKIEIINVRKWLDVNKLSLNLGKDKTRFMVFDNKVECDKLIVDNIVIEECKAKKYLGLIVDHDLSFKMHIEYIKKKLGKRIGAMYRCKSLLPIKYRKMFANSLVLPVFDYLDIIYNKASKTILLDLDILYKKVAKIALDVPKTESSIKVYKDMNWLPLHLRRQLHLASYMYRIINDTCPSNCMNKFQYVSGGTREGYNCNLYIKKSKTLKDFYYLGAKCWNSVPHHIRVTDDIKKFSKCYKTELLNSATSDINYRINNSYDNMYKPTSTQYNIEPINTETNSVLQSIGALFSTQS